MKQFLAWLATAAALQFTLPAEVHAQAADPRLDTLFSELRAATGPVQAQSLENAIWQIWHSHPNADLKEILDDGIRYMSLGALAKAHQVFAGLVERAPDWAEAWNKRATANYLLGRLEESAADIDQVLKREPRHFGALSGLGLVELARDREAEALDAFERALAVHPWLPGAGERIRALRQKLKGRPI